jgi:diaminopimelate decarboxylase
MAFAPLDPVICFAMKANDNLAVVKALVDKGAGLDIVSNGELKKALMVNADPRKIVFASVGKTDEEIRDAIRAGILLFNVESQPELDEINRIAGEMGRAVDCALRINPDVAAPTHDKITTGSLKKKFGIDLQTAREIFKTQARYPHLNINGVHIHIGSQITVGAPFVEAIQKILEYIASLRADGVTIKSLDIGGGLGIIYKDENPQTAQQYADVVVPLLKNQDLQIIMEPGRFICGNAGIFVTKVLYVKDNGVKKFLIVDGGMNDLIRPSLYEAYHDIVPVNDERRPKDQYDVVGPICESGDYFAKDRELPLFEPGELMAIMSAGAYGYVMASNYNVRGRPAEIMVKGKQFEVIKDRERFEDLVRGERVPAFLN